jgi:hypothetical protein
MNNIDILSHLGLSNDVKKPANINNTNNNNNTNDTNNKLTTTTLVWSQDHSKAESNLTSSPLGKATPSETASQSQEPLDSSCQKISHKRMPAAWRGVKLDLFCNGINKDGTANLKLNIGVIRKLDGAQIALQASLNSTWDDSVRRGVDKTAWNTESHWITAKQHRKELEYVYNIRTSKIGLKQKGGGTEMVAYVFQDHSQTWCVDILREGEIYNFQLTDTLTESQKRQGKMIATGYTGVRTQRLITAKELGI